MPLIKRQPPRTPATLHLPRTPASPHLPGADPSRRPPLASDFEGDAWAEWQAHAEAGRIPIR
jgi:hypothetical protein